MTAQTSRHIHADLLMAQSMNVDEDSDLAPLDRCTSMMITLHAG